MHNWIFKNVSSLSKEKNTLWQSFLQENFSSPRAFCAVQFSQYGPFALTNYLFLTRVICNIRNKTQYWNYLDLIIWFLLIRVVFNMGKKNKYWEYFHNIKIVLPLRPLYSAIYSTWALCTMQFTQVEPFAKIKSLQYKNNKNYMQCNFSNSFITE